MIVEAFLISVLVGFARRGRLHNLGRAPLRHIYLFFVPVLCFALACTMLWTSGNRHIVPYVRMVNVLQYVVLLIGIAVNIRLAWVWLIGLGTFSNFLVLAANGGVMPVSLSALKRADLLDLVESTEIMVRHSIMGPHTVLKPLADIMPIPGVAFIAPQVASIGDLLIAAGIFMFIQHFMLTPAPEKAAECV